MFPPHPAFAKAAALGAITDVRAPVPALRSPHPPAGPEPARRRKGRSSGPVLVVGAGPTGLTLACELARHGAAVRIVDRAAGPSTASKALAVWGRTLEVLDTLGVADLALAQGVPFRASSFYSSGRRTARLVYGPLPGTRFGQPISLPQPVIEGILLDRLHDLGVTVEWGVELTALDQDGPSVHATLRSAGGEERVQAPWAVGCDGAHSRVRELLAIPFEGAAYGDPVLLADGVIEGPLAEGELHVYQAPSGACVIVPMPGGLWRAYVSALRGSGRQEPTPGLVQSLIDAHGPGGLTLAQAHWTSAFRAQSRIAPRWRRGRVVLAGDAAHIHSPAGGQGMNTGIRDAHNLGWKLALAARGAEPEPLLDAYERERFRIAKRVIAETDRQMQVLGLQSRAARAARDAAFRAADRTGLLAAQLPMSAGLRDDYRRSPLTVPARRRRGRPSPGRRLPDVPLICAGTGAPTTSLGLLRDPRPLLLLCAGAPSAAPALARTAKRVRAAFGDAVAVRLVLSATPRLGGTGWADSVLVDGPRRLGAGVLLVRPDGHVAAAGRHAANESLLTLLTAHTPDPLDGGPHGIPHRTADHPATA